MKPEPKVLITCAAAILFAMTAARAQSLTDFLKNANLSSLAQGNEVLNLAAQSADKSPQADVNAFDDFFLINASGNLIVNFDRALQIKGQKNIPRWIGVAVYSNHDISADLQAGFEKVKQKFSLAHAKASHVVIYKTLNMNLFTVYDYAVTLAPNDTRCQEYLYVPQTEDFQKGLMTNCTWTLQLF